VEKSNVEEFAQKTSMSEFEKFYSTVQAEGKKININLLTGNEDWGSSKEIQTEIRRLIITMMETDYYNDENDFTQETHPDFKADDAVDAIIDYIDKDKEPMENQDQEDGYYQGLDTPRSAKNIPFYTLEEIRMVKLWNDFLFDRFSDQFTVFPSSFYINVNTMENNMLEALVRMQEREPTPEDLSEFMTSRSEKPFKDAKDFKERFEEFFTVAPSDKLFYSVKDRTFIIQAFGQSGDSTTKHELIVRMESKPQKTKNCDNLTPKTAKDKCEEEKEKLKNNPPLDFMRVVYWNEEAL